MNQPFLHDLVTVVAAPTVVLSGADGQILPAGAQGVLRADVRLLSRLDVVLDGTPAETVGYTLGDAGTCTFTAVARHLGDAGPDPTVRLVRERTAIPEGMVERLTLVNDAHIALRTVVTVGLASDLASIGAIKAGASTASVTAVRAGDGIRWERDGDVASVRALPRPDRIVAGAGSTLEWVVELAPHTRWSAVVEVRDEGGRGRFQAAAATPWAGIAVSAADRDVARLVDRGMADLAGLLLTDGDGDGRDVFLSAGSPWFFTLFGRDSLWAARMLLPLGTDLARGTLRTLARYQGRRVDEGTGEAPGKIIHEVRSVDIGLPPLYYGTIDATPLWVCTLHDAWRWGMGEQAVRELMGPLRMALDWITGAADADGDGFLEYMDGSGRGLANQGWKDSGDGVQWPDGRIATPPIALCEAQAYAHQAAMAGADLLAALGSDAADAERAGWLREWAEALRERFRAEFWVRDGVGRFPALALDGTKQPIDSLSSNLGHLLGTGLVDQSEAAVIAARLSAPDMDCGRGLRTLTTTAAGANPLGYHTGAVWPHDTAIAVLGLAREGQGAAAAALAMGLIDAAPAFGYRLPELFAGTDARGGEPILAYPAACRPQAWSAAAAIAVLQAALGLEADVPAGELQIRPDPAFAAWFPMRVTGLSIAGYDLTVEVDRNGAAVVETDAPIWTGDPLPD